MKRRRPQLLLKTRLCILCEGFEEYDYMRKLSSLHVWQSEYEIELVNAEGQGNLFARYQSYDQSGSYDAIFLITDTDSHPYEHYLRLKAKLNRHHHRRGVAQHLLFFGNPCTMQFILLHWAEIEELHLTSPSKSENSALIHELTGIRHYRARRSQRRKLCAQITEKNYAAMVRRVAKLPHNDKQLGNSNFSVLLEHLETPSHVWLDDHEQALR